MSTFTYTVSHDLRQPARAIIANASFLEEDFGDALPEEAKALIGRQIAAAQWMGHLIDDLLQMSRLGRTRIVKEPSDLSGLARDALEILDRERGDASVDIQDGMLAEVAPTLLRVVFQNLLENASKYRSESRPLRVEVGQADDGAYFVRDNGIGFDPTYAKKIFEPFERLHGADVEGTGFGLHNAERIIERHGGRIWAVSAPDAGTTFLFTLDESSGR